MLFTDSLNYKFSEIVLDYLNFKDIYKNILDQIENEEIKSDMIKYGNTVHFLLINILKPENCNFFKNDYMYLRPYIYKIIKLAELILKNSKINSTTIDKLNIDLKEELKNFKLKYLSIYKSNKYVYYKQIKFEQFVNEL
tara:strand:+ start:329 stop:745 length:417 start_codon:yes stop_codon:yes gene_type:complete